MSKSNNRWILDEGFKLLRESFKNKCNDCVVCEMPTNQMQFAHLKQTGLNGRGRGKINRYYNIINHPDAYLLCCEQKHKEIDS